jgi:N-acetylneuraminate synthase
MPDGSSLFGNRTFIIAEAGVNHNGNINIAKKLIDVAVEAGVDAVKFQTFSADNLVIKTAEKAEYQMQTTEAAETQYEMLKRLELSYQEHIELYNYCLQKGTMFLSTPFDFESVDLLEKLGIKMYKVSSGDLTNMPLLRYIAKKNKPIILSTGMANLGEIEEAIDWIEQEGNNRIILLHCTTSYPTAYEDVNLRVITTLQRAFKLPVGYSDHTVGTEVPIAAASMGACVIEKHFTLDKSMNGPDHKASLDPQELKYMILSIRNIEKAQGTGIKRLSDIEIKNKKIVRKSIVARKEINCGQVLSEDVLDIKRPGNGIAPKFFNKMIGMRSNKRIEKDSLIQWKDVSY